MIRLSWLTKVLFILLGAGGLWFSATPAACQGMAYFGPDPTATPDTGSGAPAGNAADLYAGAGSMTAQEALDHAKKAKHAADLGDPAEWYQIASDKGSAEAEFEVGINHWFGMAMKALAEKADKWDPDDCREYSALIRKSADQNYPPALNWMGGYYENDSCGLGTKDLSVARSYYEKAAALGNADAVTNLQKLNQTSSSPSVGSAPMDAGNKEAKKALEKGKAAADQKDYETANKWYRVAALKGNAEGEYRLGKALFIAAVADNLWNMKQKTQVTSETKIGAKNNEGLDWIRKSAEQGYAPAENSLGNYYEFGEFVGKDLEQAKSWYQKAADQGNADAVTALQKLNQATPASALAAGTSTGGGETLYQKGLDAQKAGQLQKALGFFKKSAALGNARAQAALGWLYCEGQGIKKDHYVTARKWFKKAADQGDGSGECGMGLIYLSGLGVKSDNAMSVDWLQKSAGHGYARGEYTLATCYQFGYGLAKDPVFGSTTANSLRKKQPWFRCRTRSRRLPRCTPSRERSYSQTNCDSVSRRWPIG